MEFLILSKKFQTIICKSNNMVSFIWILLFIGEYNPDDTLKRFFNLFDG